MREIPCLVKIAKIELFDFETFVHDLDRISLIF